MKKIPIYLTLAFLIVSSARASLLTTETKDGLLLGIESTDGKVHSIEVNGNQIASGGIAQPESGFLIKDIETGDTFYADGILTQNGDVITQTDTNLTYELALSATYTVNTDHILITGSIENISLTNTERAVSVKFSLPIDAHGWNWANDIRSVNTINAMIEYSNLVTTTNIGDAREISRYPWSAISRNDYDNQNPDDQYDIGLAIGTSIYEPSQFRIIYDHTTNLYQIIFDLAITNRTVDFSNRTDFSLIIYTFNDDWGFRAAADKYYRIYEQAFAKNAEKEGQWLAFTDIQVITNPEDFWFGFKEGESSVSGDEKYGLYTFTYSFPWGYWVPGATMDMTDQEISDLLDILADSGDPQAQAARNSAVYLADGSYYIQRKVDPWGQVFILDNPDLEVPEPVSEPNMYNYTNDNIQYLLQNIPALDGVFLDNVQDWLLVPNYRDSQFSVVDIPPTFYHYPLDPIILNYFSKLECIKEMSSYYHSNNYLTFGGGIPSGIYCFFFPYFDVLGTEVPSSDYGGTDIHHNYKRTMAYQKPYCLLMNTNYDTFGNSGMEKYIKKSIFYGLYPGAFSENASVNRYWENSVWVERDRELFKKYMPLAEDLGSSGWQPITHATVDGSSFYIERFGTTARDDLKFTLYAPSAITYTLNISTDFLNIDNPAGKYALIDLDNYASVPFSTTADEITATISLADDDTHILMLTRNSIANASFEQVSGGIATDWSAYQSGYNTEDNDNYRYGTKSIYCDAGGSSTSSYGVKQTIALNETVCSPLVIEGWSKTVDVGGEESIGYSLWADIIYTDSTEYYAVTSTFDPGIIGWQCTRTLFESTKAIDYVDLYCLFKNHSGRAYFDDIKLYKLDSLLEDPGYENLSANWLKLNWAGDGIEIETDDAHAGIQAFKIITDSADDISVFSQRTLDRDKMQISSTYTFSLWAKCPSNPSGANLRARVQARDIYGNYLREKVVILDTTETISSYTQYKGDFTTGADEFEWWIDVYINGGGAAILYFDDVMVYQKTDIPDFISELIEIPLTNTGWTNFGEYWPDNLIHWMDDCKVSDGNLTFSINEAERNGWIQGVIFYFDNFNQVFKQTPGDSEYLREHHAYLIWSNLDNLKLQIPIY